MKVGDRVQDVRDRTKVGVITDGPEVRGGRTLWRVRWDDNNLSRIPAEFLEPEVARKNLWDLIRAQAFGGMEDFVRSYTHRKLLNPVDDTLYTLHASRTKLLPHQFKPLLRYLDSIHRRYLIADEVGLGKTIEAGIIMSELRARERLGGVLIYCPNHLREKWHAEMLRRFDERFDIIASRQEWNTRVVTAAEQVGTSGFRVIVGHKTLASKRIWEALTEQVPAFDLVIVDEAHHFKNPETYSRRILGELADAANQLLLLTATPLQTASENLLSLLRLIDYKAFRSKELFDERLGANVHLVRAERFLKAVSSNGDEASVLIRSARKELAQISARQVRLFGLNEDGGRDRAIARLEELEVHGLRDGLAPIADAASEIQQANLLSPYVTRTRKVEVQDSCQRIVESVRPDLAPEERHFYDSVMAWVRERIRILHGESRIGFLSREIERRLASSFPAFARYLRHPGARNSEILTDPPSHVLEAGRRLREDTKSLHLVRLLDRIRQDRPDAKVLVFASFRGTLRHLSHVLNREGWDHEVIHGGVPLNPTDPDRDLRGARVRRFLHDEDCRILLSSNVGGEGLDLQRASIVINYDLPWNPAVVEQRIGRVDRFGQTEPLIQIMNFVLPETVEDHIFGRLFDRLNLFEMTLGDFAEVLGNIVTDLSTDFLRTELNQEDLSQKLQAAEWRVENERKNLEVVLEREHDFVAFDEDFADHLRRLEAEGQTIRPDDLHRVVDGVLQRHFPSSWIRPAEGPALKAMEVDASAIYELHVDSQLHTRLKQELQSRESATFWSIIRRVNEGSTILVTFDGEVAERHPDELELITSRHPLLRLLVQQQGEATHFHKLASIAVPRPDGIEVDRGLLVLFHVLFRLGAQERRLLRPVLMTSDGEVASHSARRLLRFALDKGRSSKPNQLPDSEEVCRMLDRAQEVASDETDRIVDRLINQEERRIRPRVAEVEERYSRRLERANARVWEIALAIDDPEQRKRLQRAQQYVRRLERELKSRVAELSQLPEPEVHVQAEAAAWVEVEV
jgi:superfamily II DNA or RNA helicase